MNESSEDRLQRYKAQLGNEFGAAFHALSNEWMWALMRFNEFQELFGSEEDVSLLNALTGGDFAWDIQQILWDDLLLRVCRLTDPSTTRRGRRNLSVKALPLLVEEHTPNFVDEVRLCVNVAVQRAEFARSSRNKRIGHLDWDRATKQGTRIAETTIQRVGSALDAVHAVLHLINVKLLDSEMLNTVYVKPRASAFLSYARQLVDSVRFIDGLIDGEGETSFTDTKVARTFLVKVGCEPTTGNVREVIELREVHQRFK